MKNIKLYSNLKDNSHCFQACLKMSLNYFGKNYSFKKLDEITGFKKNKTTWSTKGLLYLSEHGYKIINICNFNFKRFAHDGEKYLKYYYTPDAYIYQKKYSDFKKEQKLTKKVLKSKIKLINKPKITLTNLKKYKNYLIIASVNSNALAKKKGYINHSVVITKITNKYIYFNDPGLPAGKRKISKKMFLKTINDEIIFIKKK